MNLISTLNRKRHLLFDNDQTEIGRWLDREFPGNRELFVYFHHDTGNWVIGAWQNNEHSMFYDMINLGPTGMANVSKDELQKRLSPLLDWRQVTQGMQNEEYRELRQLTDDSMIDSEKRHKRKIQIVVPG